MSEEGAQREEREQDVPGEERCASCGEPVDPRQLVCLNCGGRVALEERRSWTSDPLAGWAAGLVVLIVVGAGLFGFAIAELTSGEDDGGNRAAPVSQPRAADEGPQVVSGSGQRVERSDAPAEPEPASTTAAEPSPAGSGAVLRWPAELSAHTVVLVTSSDRPAATEVAREARRQGLQAGLFSSDPYDLGSGLWVVYAGRFDSRAAAARRAGRLQERYPGAYPQFVQSSQ